MTMEQKQEIECEQITIKVPKPIMPFLRFLAETNEWSVEEQIESCFLTDLRAMLEGMSGEEFVAMLDLGPVFYELLGDTHYKPKEAKTEDKAH
jgi:hypothetical protein